MANDVIRIQGISVLGYHGVHEWERTQGQQFLVDLEVTLDVTKAAQSDELAQTVNYSALAKKAHDVVAGDTHNLLETVGWSVAAETLKNSLVERVKVTVHKPNADCGVGVADVSVTIERGRETFPRGTSQPHTDSAHNWAPRTMDKIITPDEVEQTKTVKPIYKHGEPGEDARTEETIVLSLGANLGDAEHNLRWAVGQLANHEQISLTGTSPLVRTPAQLAPEQDAQPDYSNAIVTINTSLTVGELFDFTQSLEIQAGRQMGQHWQPRPLDIDIIAVGQQEWETERLQIPHPRAAQRIFVLGPWAMLDQSAYLPGHGLVAELADALPTRDDIMYFDAQWLDAGYPDKPWQGTGDEDVTYSESTPITKLPRRQSIRERVQAKDPYIEAMEQELLGNTSAAEGAFEDPMPEAEAYAASPVARTTTSMRRVVVRPTTTGTIPVLPAEDLKDLDEYLETDRDEQI